MQGDAVSGKATLLSAVRVLHSYAKLKSKVIGLPHPKPLNYYNVPPIIDYK